MSTAARFRSALAAGATAIVIGSGFTVVGLSKHAAGAQIPSAAQAPLAAGATPALLDESVGASPGAPSPTASPTASQSATRRAPLPRRTTRPAPSATTRPATPASDSAVIDQVLTHINAARTDAGLSPLTLDADLSKASALHNQLMIDGCGLAHQCPGESGIGKRFSAQGVQWTIAGENIGYGSSGSGDAQIVKAANGLTDSMLAEQPPNDGHRKNLLNSRFTRIGLSVLRDGDGLTWMTQDFVG